MDNQQIKPTGVEGIQEPSETISKEEINEKIKQYWKEVETTEGFDK